MKYPGLTVSSKQEAFDMNPALKQAEEAFVTSEELKKFLAARVLSTIRPLPESFEIAEKMSPFAQALSSLDVTKEESQKIEEQLSSMQQQLNLFFHLKHEILFAQRLLEEYKGISSAVDQQLITLQQEIAAVREAAVAAQSQNWIKRKLFGPSSVVPSEIESQELKIERLQQVQSGQAQNMEQLSQEIENHTQQIGTFSREIIDQFFRSLQTFDPNAVQEKFVFQFQERCFYISHDIAKSLFYFSGILPGELEWSEIRDSISSLRK